MRNIWTIQNVRQSRKTRKGCKNTLKLKLMSESKILTLVDLTEEKLILTKFSNSRVKDIIPMLIK